MTAWQTVLGLEVHVQLKTRTKLFCACPNAFGERPSTLVCPVGLGLPGVLPVPNKEAVEKAVVAGSALNFTVNLESRFDRKRYFYRDIPKKFQITQCDRPICEHGVLRAGGKEFKIRRAHLEEDAGKPS